MSFPVIVIFPELLIVLVLPSAKSPIPYCPSIFALPIVIFPVFVIFVTDGETGVVLSLATIPILRLVF